jgi:hypothetical protein
MQLPTTATVEQIVGSGPQDAFALTRSAANEQQLFHYNGSGWSRVRTPVSSFDSGIAQLWTNGRVTFLGGTGSTGERHFNALIRTEPW